MGSEGGSHTHTHRLCGRERWRGERYKESDGGMDSEGGIEKVERGYEREAMKEGHTHTHT